MNWFFFRSPVLKTVNISRKVLKKSLINIIEGSILTRRQHQAVSKLIEKTEKGGNSEKISKRINLKWMKNLLEEQLQKESDYYKIGKDFQKTKLRGNIKAGKRKLFHELDELDEIEELPSTFTTIPTDRSKKIRAAQKVFHKVIKQVPSTDCKKIKINYDETNNITIQEKERNEWTERKKTWRKKFTNPKFI